MAAAHRVVGGAGFVPMRKMERRYKTQESKLNWVVSKLGINAIRESKVYQNICRNGKKVIKDPVVWFFGSVGFLSAIYRNGVVNSSFLQFASAFIAVNFVINKSMEIAYKKKIISFDLYQKISHIKRYLNPIIAIGLYQSFACSTPLLAAAGFMALMSIAISSFVSALPKAQREVFRLL